MVRQFEPADWRRPVPRPKGKDPWTVKDALVHIVHWKANTARVFRGEKSPPEFRGLDVNAANSLVYERRRRRDPTDVIAFHRQVQREVMRTLDKMAAEDFSRREHSDYWPSDLTRHSARHRLRDIEAALKASGKGTGPRA